MNSNLRSMITDWYKYFNTVVPEGVNRKLYTHLKYAVRQKLEQCHEKGYDPLLVEKVAVYDFLSQDEKTIRNRIEMYME